MKKTLLIMLFMIGIVNASDTNTTDVDSWRDIKTYESVKIDKDKYQVKIINKGNFLENDLFVDSENNFLLEEGSCKYKTKMKNKKAFAFIGDGSIKCKDNIAVKFISVEHPNKNLLFFESVLAEGIIHTVPIWLLMIFIGVVFFIGSVLKDRRIISIGMLLTLPAFVGFAILSYKIKIQFKGNVNEYIKKQIQEDGKKDGKIYYIRQKYLV